MNKGIEVSSLSFPHEIAIEVLGELGRRAAFLSGPSFAVEVVRREPTCVAVGSEDLKSTERAQQLFFAPYFRVYSLVWKLQAH